MLDDQQAGQIVIDCIRAVSHVGSVSLNGTLDDADIIDTTRVNNVITLIVNSTSIGVPSLQHRINANFFLGVGPSTVAAEVAGIVRDRSFPAPQHRAEEFAAMLAEHLGARRAPAKPRRAAKKGGGTKAAKKGGGAKAAKKPAGAAKKGGRAGKASGKAGKKGGK